MIEILQYPFIQRALIAGIILGLLFAVLGVFVILRKMAFWGDGIAHASLAGIAFALLAGYSPMAWAIIVAVIFAVLIFYLERRTTLSHDAIIGILFTAFMALGVVLLSLSSGYQPELISFLFGNILSVTTLDVYLILILGLIILAFVWRNSRQLSLLTFDRETAYISGVNVHLLDLVFYIALAVAVVLGVKILGVILVSALLIIPASIGKVVSRSYASLKVMSVILSEIIIIAGLFISFYFDLPSGATIILTGTVIFIAAHILKIAKIYR